MHGVPSCLNTSIGHRLSSGSPVHVSGSSQNARAARQTVPARCEVFALRRAESPSSRLPSSHTSPSSTRPLPHTGGRMGVVVVVELVVVVVVVELVVVVVVVVGTTKRWCGNMKLPALLTTVCIPEVVFTRKTAPPRAVKSVTYAFPKPSRASPTGITKLPPDATVVCIPVVGSCGSHRRCRRRPLRPPPRGGPSARSQYRVR